MRTDSTGTQAEAKVCGAAGPVNAGTPLVVLWDIDGTLLSSDGAGRWAMEQAFSELFGVDSALSDIELAGRTDEAILLDAARSAAVTLGDDDRAEFMARYAGILKDELASGRRAPRALPGVEPLLSTLASDPRFTSGLLTGNWRHSAYIKLAAVGLASWFPFGAFAGDAHAREDLLPIALERAEWLSGARVPACRAAIVGDTPRDVRVATTHGARCIAVATGPHTADELSRTGADLVVDDLTDRRVMAALAEWHAVH
jgi:phosphoglycolate phosphatase-like HAD superfamily hydrolase